MDWSSDDENKISPNDETIEICINDVSMEDRSKENLNVQTKTNIIEHYENSWFFKPEISIKKTRFGQNSKKSPGHFGQVYYNMSNVTRC
jgi:hypothetical protein